MDKQRERHPELTCDDYMVLRPAILSGEVRFERARSAVVLYVDTKQIDWAVRAHLKATNNGRELYVDSFCLLRQKTYRQALAKRQTVLRPHK